MYEYVDKMEACSEGALDPILIKSGFIHYHADVSKGRSSFACASH